VHGRTQFVNREEQGKTVKSEKRKTEDEQVKSQEEKKCKEGINETKVNSCLAFHISHFTFHSPGPKEMTNREKK
jgi:hypothetical protein